jgi:hypothetical protein
MKEIRTIELKTPLPCGVKVGCGRDAYEAQAYKAEFFGTGDRYHGQWVILPICSVCAAAAVAIRDD